MSHSGLPVDEDAFEAAPIRHTFVVLTAKSEVGARTVKVQMPSEAHKMVCGAVTSVGNTIVLGSFPESSTVWTAVHDPARSNARIVLKVLALIDEEGIYETTVKRLQYSHLSAEEPALAWGEANPKGLLEHRIGAKGCTMTCPIPSKYTLCGGGFYSPMPVVNSGAVPVRAYARALGGRREQDAFGGGGWSIQAPADDRLAVFAVGLRVRRGAAVQNPKIAINLEGGTWRAQLPAPQDSVVVHLGASNCQDPAAAALFLTPSEASKVAISRAPPSVWAQYHTPYRSIVDKERDKQYTKATIDK